MMKMSLWLLIATLARVSIQQCTVEEFDNKIAFDILQSTQATEFNQNFTINKIIYNCLSTSQTIGIYRSMSASILYTRSDSPDRLRDMRYDMQCKNDVWMRRRQSSTALESNDTRINCSDCFNTTNDHHCTPCDSLCTGLNQCYGSTASECCNYNDRGTCTDECGMNKEVNSTFHCVCSNYWIGDDCANCSLVCMNGGTQNSDCTACHCISGYEGTVCNVNINECDPDPCHNGGNCTDLINDYNCTCAPGYTGINCSINIDDCDPNPCLNEGNCTDGIDTYTCTCVTGFNGTNCDINIDDCAINPCQNNGSCSDGINEYSCACVTGYTGNNCETDIDDCDPNPCLNRGTCTDKLNDYTCTCAAGYTGNTCETDIDDCSNDPCQNRGTCIDLVNGYRCNCKPSFSGPDCSDCTLPNCEECEESEQHGMGKCTKCAGVFELYQGTCNDNCGIPNCILCDKLDNKCIQCKVGYQLTSDGKCEEERAVEVGRNSNNSSEDLTIVIIATSIAGLIVLGAIITAVVALRYECKKPNLRRPNSISRNYHNL